MDFMSIAGGLLGALGSGDSKQSQSSEKTPWGPSQGWLTSNINSGQQLQDYYQRNPLSADQQQAYANSKALSNNSRGLFGNLTNQMNSTKFFDRSNPLTRPEALQFTSQGFGDPQASGMGGGAGLSAPFTGFSKPAASQVRSNPFGSGISDRRDTSRDVNNTPGWYDTTTPEERMAFFKENPFQAGITGLFNEYASKMPYVGSFIDPAKAAQYAAEARGTYGAEGRAAAEAIANPAIATGTPEAAAMAAAYAAQGGDTSRGGGGGSGASGGFGSSPGYDSGGPGDGTAADYWKGGYVKKAGLRGPDPAGPDEGSANLQSGEYVVKKSAVKKLGKGLLDAVNSGDKQKIRGLLA